MNNEVRKKVLLDLFGHPVTLFPLFGSLATFVLSWAVAWNPLLLLSAIVLGLVGVGSLATRIALGGDKLFQRQLDYMEAQKEEEENEYLDDLDARLCKDRDPRDQNCLREIRSMYDGLKAKIKDGELVGGERLLKTVKELFDACVSLLEEAYTIYTTYKKLEKGTTARNKLKQDREQKIIKCLEATEHLRRAINAFQESETESSGKTIDQLRKDLDRQIDVARQVGQLGSDTDREYERFISERKVEE